MKECLTIVIMKTDEGKFMPTLKSADMEESLDTLVYMLSGINDAVAKVNDGL